MWLWYRLVAAAPIGPLAWEPPYATGMALKRPKKKKNKQKNKTKKKKKKKKKRQKQQLLWQYKLINKNAFKIDFIL